MGKGYVESVFDTAEKDGCCAGCFMAVAPFALIAYFFSQFIAWLKG